MEFVNHAPPNLKRFLTKTCDPPRAKMLVLEDLTLWMAPVPSTGDSITRLGSSKNRAAAHSLMVEGLLRPEPTGGFTSANEVRLHSKTPLCAKHVFQKLAKFGAFWFG